MLIEFNTRKTVNEAADALRAAVAAKHFGVMQVHDLKESMAQKGFKFSRECLIFEVCQQQQAKLVLEQNISVSAVLPSRISIYEKGGSTVLAAVRPTTLLAMCRSPQLESVAEDVENTIFEIMREAATARFDL